MMLRLPLTIESNAYLRRILVLHGSPLQSRMMSVEMQLFTWLYTMQPFQFLKAKWTLFLFLLVDLTSEDIFCVLFLLESFSKRIVIRCHCRLTEPSVYQFSNQWDTLDSFHCSQLLHLIEIRISDDHSQISISLIHNSCRNWYHWLYCSTYSSLICLIDCVFTCSQ